MDVFVLQAIIRELDEALRGARLEKVAQPEALTLLLTCSGPGRRSRRLLLSADPGFPRLHLTGGKMPGPAEPPPFCRSLRKHLTGCRFTRIAAQGWERVVQISLERPGSGGGPTSFALMVEVMGRWSNILLLEGRTGRIIDSIKTVSREESRERLVLRNLAYRLPPAQKKLAPEAVDEAALRRLLAEDGMEAAPPQALSRWLVKTIGGISPLVASEIVGRAGPGDGWSGLWAAFSGVAEALRQGRFRPAVVLGAEGAPAGLSALELRSLGPGRVRVYESMNEAADGFYAEAVAGSVFSARRAEFSRAIARRAGWVRRALDAIARDLRASEGAEEERRKGEILLENVKRVEEKAASFLTVRDGRRVEIALDPRLSAAANAQRYFRRYKKLKRLGAIGGARRKEVEGERAFLDGLLFDLEEAESADDLEAVGAALAAAGYASRQKGDAEKARRAARGKREAARPPYRRFRSPGGWEVFVGRSAMGNEALLRRVGRAGDTWLHAQGVPGSHVILRTPGGKGEPPEGAVRGAAALAAHHSRGRGAGKLPVDVLPFRRVRRPRGARPGQVVLSGQRTVVVRPEEGEKLLEELEEIG